MRKIIIAANWKMNKNKADAISFIDDLLKFNDDYSAEKVIQLVCPPNLYLDALNERCLDTDIYIGAQNCSQYDNGAYTGEISVEMLNDLNLKYCIIGHSERRQIFNETNEMIYEKFCKLIDANITPVLCIGETLQEREQNLTFDVIQHQLSSIFNHSNSIGHDFVIAYEPVWAIGTGKTASPEQAQEVHHFIRNWFETKYSADFANSISILYGGSVKPDNIKELLSQQDIDGGLIGGAALDIQSYKKMLSIAGEI